MLLSAVARRVWTVLITTLAPAVPAGVDLGVWRRLDDAVATVPTLPTLPAPTVGPWAIALVVVVVLALLPMLAARGFRRVFREQDLDLLPPSHGSGWSGGTASLVSWTDLGREGRRLLARAPVAPGALRLYVGLDSVPGLDERVALAMAEAERSGAFRRGAICVAVPTGSGWVNPAALEALERATDGDVATIVVQYAAEPSWLSARAHPGAHHRSAEAVLRAVHARWAVLDPDARPRLVVLGESLGANGLRTALDRLPHVVGALSGGLLVGGIGSVGWEPGAVSPVGLVRHDDDPVVRLALPDAVRPAGLLGADAAARPSLASRWRALVALAGVLRALPGAGGAPEGCGHHYGRELGVAWRTNLGPARRSAPAQRSGAGAERSLRHARPLVR